MLPNIPCLRRSKDYSVKQNRRPWVHATSTAETNWASQRTWTNVDEQRHLFYYIYVCLPFECSKPKHTQTAPTKYPPLTDARNATASWFWGRRGDVARRIRRVCICFLAQHSVQADRVQTERFFWFLECSCIVALVCTLHVHGVMLMHNSAYLCIFQQLQRFGWNYLSRCELIRHIQNIDQGI